MRQNERSNRWHWGPGLLGRAGIVYCLCLQLASAMTFKELEERLNSETQPSTQLELLIDAEQYLSQFSTLEQGTYWYRVGRVQTQLNRPLDGEQSYGRSIEILTPPNHPPSEQLVLSLTERSTNRRMRTFDTTTFCDDRKQAVFYARQLDQPSFLAGKIAFYVYCFIEFPEKADEAFTLLDEAIELAGKHDLTASERATIYNASAFTYFSFHAYEKAYEFYFKAYELWKEDGDIFNMTSMQSNLVSAAIKTAKFDLARQHVDQLFELSRDYSEFQDSLFYGHYFSGILAKTLQNWPAAIAAFQQALEQPHKTGYFLSAHELLVIAYFRAGQIEDSAAFYAEMRSKFPDYIKSTASHRYEMNSIAGYHNGDYSSSLGQLFAALDEEAVARRSFLKQSSANSTLLHSSSIVQLENTVLQQDLAINQLKLEQEEKESQLFRLTLLFTLLSIAALLLVTWHLVRTRRLFREKSQIDFLTGVASRRYFFEVGERLVQSAVQQNVALSLLLVDVDNFKTINDSFGHHVGDSSLIDVVNVCKSHLSKSDLIGRLGGDEFVILLPGQDSDAAKVVAEEICSSIATLRIHNQADVLSVSVGVVQTRAADSLKTLMARVDQALYRAKELGKNQTVFET